MATTQKYDGNAPLSGLDPASVTTSTPARALDIVAMVLMIVGGLNWALVGLFDYDLVASLLGPMSTGSRIVYVLVGLAAVYGIVILARMLGRRI